MRQLGQNLNILNQIPSFPFRTVPGSYQHIFHKRLYLVHICVLNEWEEHCSGDLNDFLKMLWVDRWRCSGMSEDSTVTFSVYIAIKGEGWVVCRIVIRTGNKKVFQNKINFLFVNRRNFTKTVKIRKLVIYPLEYYDCFF